MPRVETVVSPSLPPAPVVAQAEAEPPYAEKLIWLRHTSILVSDENRAARPGVPPMNEDKRLARLAKSMLHTGQVMPIVVYQASGNYYIIDGLRRVRAAQIIENETGQSFPLACVVEQVDNSSSRRAIHANVHRSNLTPLQFATLCQHLRKDYGWTGTKEVAEFLGVSRAQVSQHDKLLHKPEGMSEDTYTDLLAQVGSGVLGADSAFYALTRVKPEKAQAVMQRAEELRDKTKKADVPTGTATTTKVEKKLIERAARELKAEKPVKTSKSPKQETAVFANVSTGSEYEKLIDDLTSDSYPKVMRVFAKLLSTWMTGEDQDSKRLLTQWNQIALLIDSIEAHQKTAKPKYKPRKGN